MTAAKAPIGQWFEIGVYWERAKTPNGQFAVYIDGVATPMESRQTKLRDRYLQVNEDKPQAYERQ